MPASRFATFSCVDIEKVASVWGIRRYRPRQLAAWCLLAAGEFFFIAGDTTYTVLRVIFHEANPFPSLGDALVLAMLVRLIGGGGLRMRSMQLLVLGAVGLLVSDALYGLIQLNGDWHENSPVDTGWVVFYLAWGCAALQPSMVGLGDILPVRSPRLGGWRTCPMSAHSCPRCGPSG